MMNRFLTAVFGLVLLAAEAHADVVVTPLATGPLLHASNGITNDGTNLYVTTSAASPRGSIVSVPLTGGSATQLYTYSGQPPQGTASGLGITTLGGNVFVIDPNSGPFSDAQILKAPSNGSGPVTAIYTGSSNPFPHPFLDGSGITNDGSRLYWSDEVGGFVFAINKDGSGITQVGPQRYTGGFGTEHFNAIAAFGGNLFIADSGRLGVTDPEVITIPTSGGSFTTLFAGSPFIQPVGIAVGNDTLFIADSGADAIFSLPLMGGMPTLLVSDSRFASLSGLTFFNNALYVTDSGTGTTGTIFKVDLSPVAPTVVPEPGSLVVFGAGLLGLVGFMWKRRKLIA
jgi:hypothetical protein